jgi:hypothetical protein
VLWSLGISAQAIAREVADSRAAVIATTDSRSHLGTLNDFAYLLYWQLKEHPDLDLTEHAVRLAATPVGPLDGFPDQSTRQLLEH